MRKLIPILLLISCATAQSLIPLDKIKNPEAAQKALIIAQDIRVRYMRIVKETAKSEDDLAKFESIDKGFRISWAVCDKLVTDWKLTGTLNTKEFSENYEKILSSIEAFKHE